MAEFEPVLTRNWNVHDGHTLAVYESRGGYQASRKALTTMEPDQVVERGQGLGAARSGRGGVPLRAQVEFPPEGPEGDPHVRQRRRERAGDVQQPAPDRAATRTSSSKGSSSPASPPGRRWPTCTSATSTSRAIAILEKAIAEAREAGHLGQEHLRVGVRPGRLVAPGGGGVHLRRGDRADREPGGEARLAADQAAVPGDRGGLPQADGRQQRRDALLRAAHHRAGRRLVQVDRHAQELRAEAVLRLGARQQAGLRRAARWASPAAS